MFHLVTDGACGPRNPGFMAVGVVIFNPKGELFYQYHGKLVWGTNSTAEYEALIRGLEAARDLKLTRIRASVDSQLLYHQLSGSYQVRAKHLKSLHRQVKSLMRGFSYVELMWHSRETPEARIADAVSKGQSFKLGDVLCPPVVEAIVIKAPAPPTKLVPKKSAPVRRFSSFQDLKQMTP